MGGVNSGSWYRWNRKATVEECRKIDIRYLKKVGRLQPISGGSLSWSRGSEPIGSVRYKIYEHSMEISFQCREHGGEWEDIKQSIRITETPCHFGGVRKWLVCPNCNRRVTTLCQDSKYFLCRHCYDLTYSSCSEHWIERIMRKRENIKKKLGANPNSDWIPEKPKGMHLKTYEKYYQQFVGLDDCASSALLQMM